MTEASIDPHPAGSNPADTTAPGAVASVVYGILGLFLFGLIVGWVAINHSREALGLIDKDPSLKGAGLAKAGIVLGIIDILIWTGILGYKLLAGVDA
ncbi:MAG: hypothetical protein ACI9WU_000502 [Myxococcota bacterium]|jgi:hypothetical protein